MSFVPSASAVSRSGPPGQRRASRHLGRAVVVTGAALALAVPVLLAAPASAEPEAASAATRAAASTGVDPAACRVSKILVPTCGSWLGVSPSPQGTESYDESLGLFEERIDRTVDIVHYYTRGDQLFPTNSMLERANEPGHERLLMINWTPEVTWREVADGAVDDYLVSLAEYLKSAYTDTFFFAPNAEPERDVIKRRSSGMTAQDFARFYRHTIDVLEDNGVTNTVNVMNYVGIAKWGDMPWFDDLWPGDRYVDWIAEDPFAFGDEPGVWLSDFAGMVDRVQPGSDWPGFYTWATTQHPGLPIMLAEWGVSEEAPKYPSYKPDFFDNTLAQLADFPALKGLVYWDHPGGTTVGETRVNSSKASLREFTQLGKSSKLTRPGEFYLGRPADDD